MGPAADIHPAALLAFSRAIRRVDTYDQLVDVVRAEVSAALGFTNAWLYVFERADDTHCTLVAVAGPKASDIRREAPRLPQAGDWLVQALARDEGLIVIPDAQLDPKTPEVARRLENRTVVNLPMGVVDAALGFVGCGTFGDDGTVEIPEAAESYLFQIANITSVAVARLVLRGREDERRELHERMAQRQRLESLGLLAGGVAHDFNNLMTVIRMAVELMRRESLSEHQDADLDLIADTERRASSLTRKLLILGQQQHLAMESCDINTVVNDFLRLLDRVVAASIKLDFVPGAALPCVHAERVQLEQVLMNLALNARDAMPDGGRLTIETQEVLVNGEYRRAHPWAIAGRYVLLTVSDTGQGMPPEVMERVYEPFYTTKPVGEGTGLGLAVTWSIVKQHGGMIHCYSEPGVGTTFKVYLPAGTQQASLVGSKVAAAPRGGREHILLADDQPEVRALVCRTLEAAGYTVTAVGDGASAVAAATAEAFDLHLFDAVMPHLGGREACEQILVRRPDARFLLASGYSADVIQTAALRDLGVRVLAKPFDPDALLRAVRYELDRAPTATTTA